MKKFFSSIGDALKGKTMKYGSNMVISVALVIAIVIVINMLIGLLPLKLDLTQNKLYSLGDTTKKLLNGLDTKVQIYALFDDGKIAEGDRYGEIVELLKLYDEYLNIEVIYADPERNPGLVSKLDPSKTRQFEKQDFAVKSGNKVKKLTEDDLLRTVVKTDPMTGMNELLTIGSKAENAFSGAIKFVTAEKTPVIYFTEGHGEGMPDKDYTMLRDYLQENNYEVKTLNLSTQEVMPDDAEAIFMMSLKTDIFSGETELLRDYLDNGGKLFVMADYLEMNPEFTQLNNLLSEYNIEIQQDKVKETNQAFHTPNDPYFIISQIARDESDFFPKVAVNYPEEAYKPRMSDARSIKILKNEKSYITTIPLLKTSPSAVGESLDKEDSAGPLNLVVMSTKVLNENTKAKVLVMGNADFVSDNMYRTYENYYQVGKNFMAITMNNVLTKTEDIGIETRYYASEILDISQEQAKQTERVAIYVLPSLVFVAGMLVWLRRRHL